jgi:hypothetical protein
MLIIMSIVGQVHYFVAPKKAHTCPLHKVLFFILANILIANCYKRFSFWLRNLLVGMTYLVYITCSSEFQGQKFSC